MFSTQDYERFVKSCFPKNFGDWHDGLDAKALLNLTGYERWKAEKIILRGIKNNKGTSIDAAGILQLKSASKLLKNSLQKKLIEKKHYSEIVNIAWALHQIENYPDSFDIIVNYIENTNGINAHDYEFFSIFKYLVSFGDDRRVIDFLERLISTEDKSADKLKYIASFTLEEIRQGKRTPYGTSTSS